LPDPHRELADPRRRLSPDLVPVFLQRFYTGRVVTDRRSHGWLTTPGALRVPEITVYFWVIKALSTALGESTSDYLVHALSPVSAVLLGFVFFVAALVLQFSVRRYIAWTYWLAVCMVGVFGTMAADVLHVGFGVPYIASSLLYAVILAAVFITWGRTEPTLSIHSIDTPRREIFYWLAVVATFAMGTALGDLTATTLHLGYLASGFLFAGVIAIPALGYRFLRWNAVFSFWFAYVATRPFGASFADYFGKPKSVGGLGLGDGRVALVLAIVIFCLVAFLAVTHRDEQRGPAGAVSGRAPGRPARGTHGREHGGSGPRHGAHSGASVPAMDYARPGPGTQPGDYGRAGSDAQPGDYRHPQPGTPPSDDATMRHSRPRPGGQPEDY
jgi:uncharacterized membrane-anchored protein